jgi:RNA polymerase sigma-70 factor (ECF subfamily)
MWGRRDTTGTAPPRGGEATEEDDQAVVLRAVVDRRAFAPLYEKYLTPVYRRCFGHLRDADEAWDAAGVTFHNALAGLDGFRGGSFEGWLLRIADHACADVHRRRARRPQVPFDGETDRPGSDPDPEEQALAALDRERLEKALRQLPPRRERIVRLHLAGLTGKEIAARLGVSHDVVRQQQRLAFLQLATLLGVDRDGKEGRDG